MKIVVLCDGLTEAVLRDGLHEFVEGRARHAEGTGIKTINMGGTTLQPKLARLVRGYLVDPEVIGVIALTDVYPGFDTAEKAKDALLKHAEVGKAENRFRAHAAKFELEAWLLPSWGEIAKHLRVKAKSPGPKPEDVNGEKPPSHRLKTLFKQAGRDYGKAFNARKWLTATKLKSAAEACPELKLFLNSMLEFAGAEPLP